MDMGDACQMIRIQGRLAKLKIIMKLPKECGDKLQAINCSVTISS
jgi:hypothetical protein